MVKYIAILIIIVGCTKPTPVTSPTPCNTNFVGLWVTTDKCTSVLDITKVNDNYININNDVNCAVKCNEFYGVYPNSKVNVRGYYVNDSTMNVEFSVMGDTCRSVYIK